MDMFVCEKCDCVDAVELAFVGDLPREPEKQVCTFCKTRTWHNVFRREVYDPDNDLVCNRPTGIALG